MAYFNTHDTRVEWSIEEILEKARENGADGIVLIAKKNPPDWDAAEREVIMPVSIEYAEDGIGVILRHQDVVTGEELFEAISAVYDDDRFVKLKYWMGDRTECTQFLLDKAWVEKIAVMNTRESRRNPGILLALVAPDDLQFGMSRMYQVYEEESAYRTHVFRSREAAEDWIRQSLDSA